MIQIKVRHPWVPYPSQSQQTSSRSADDPQLHRQLGRGPGRVRWRRGQEARGEDRYILSLSVIVPRSSIYRQRIHGMSAPSICTVASLHREESKTTSYFAALDASHLPPPPTAHPKPKKARLTVQKRRQDSSSSPKATHRRLRRRRSNLERQQGQARRPAARRRRPHKVPLAAPRRLPRPLRRQRLRAAQQGRRAGRDARQRRRRAGAAPAQVEQGAQSGAHAGLSSRRRCRSGKWRESKRSTRRKRDPSGWRIITDGQTNSQRGGGSSREREGDREGERKRGCERCDK